MATKLIAEELLLIALDSDGESVPVGAGSYLPIGLCGALLAELMLAGSLTVSQGRVVPVGTRPADPLLAEVWELISSASPGKKTKSAVRRLDKQLGGVRRRSAGGSGCIG